MKSGKKLSQLVEWNFKKRGFEFYIINDGQYDMSFEDGLLHLSFYEIYIIIILKMGNYHSCNLSPNILFKDSNSALAWRLLKALPLKIYLVQSGIMKGCQVPNNIRLLIIILVIYSENYEVPLGLCWIQQKYLI